MSTTHARIQRRGGTTTNVVVGAVIFLSVLCGWKMMRPAPLVWLPTVDAGLDEAERLQRPILLFFTADWCPPCQRLKREVFKDGDVTTCLRDNWVLVKIDLTREDSPNQDVAMQHGVQGIPTLKAFDLHGDLVGEYEGPRTPGHVMRWLQSNAK